MTTPLPPNKRFGAPRLTIFNHKGGVGKTTLTVNVAAAIGRKGIRVLLVDSDPQGNLTSYLVDDDVVNDLLDTSDSPGGNTIWSAVRPVLELEGKVRMISPLERLDGVFLLPGDIRLAEFEAQLSTFWSECFQRRIRGFRGTTTLSELVDQQACELGADIVLYDTGPNIGALNRVILLDCDYFVIPAAADLFSLRAIKTLGHTLREWILEWRTIAELAPDGIYLLPGSPRLIGYVPQRFRVYSGRPAKDYATLFPRIERAVSEDVLAVLRKVDPDLASAAASPLKLGEIKDFGSLANASQREGVPIDEVRMGNAGQRAEAREQFERLANAVLRRVGLSEK